MNQLLIHLSDIHLKDDGAIDTSSFLSVVKNHLNEKTENIFICFTGDMTRTCKTNQFTSFNNFIQTLKNDIKKLSQAAVWVLIVPGNHDICLNNLTRTSSQITEWLNQENLINDKFLIELNECSDALSICNRYDLVFEDNLFAFAKYNLGSIDINFVGLNSAPFSSKHHDDKDHHFIPQFSHWPYIDNSKKQITIFMSHHRPDWFEETSQKAFNSYLANNVSILLHGHEHEYDQKYIDGTKLKLSVLAGGELKTNNSILCGSFNVVEIDDDCLESIKCYGYEFNFNSSLFVCKSEKNMSVTFKPFRYLMKQDFLNKFFVVEEITDSKRYLLNEIFEMPYLTSQLDDDLGISSFDELIRYFEEKKRLFLFGQSGEGKTSILKMIFNYYKDKKWCIYLDENNFNPNNMENSIKLAFFSQYSEDQDLFLTFKSSPKEQKLLLLDNIKVLNTPSKLKHFSSYVSKEFDYFGATGLEIDEQLFSNDTSNLFNQYYAFRCLGMIRKQREAFIVKICNKNGIFDDLTIKRVLSSIYNSLSLSSTLDIASPNLLLLLAHSVISKKMYEERNTSNAFSVVFEDNINNMLSSFGKREYLDDYYLVLSFVAFEAFERSNIIISENELYASFNNAKKESGYIAFEFSHFENIVCQCGLIQKIETGKYKFYRNSLLSFFAAKRISSFPRTKRETVIKDLISAISYGLNSDVFLFVIYFLKESEVIEIINDKINYILEGIDEIDFDEKNITVLKKESKFHPETRKQAETRHQIINRISDSEKKRLKTITKKEQQVFDNSKDESFSNYFDKISKSIKLIEILCKATSGFKQEINGKSRTNFINTVISACLKILYLLFDIDKAEAEYRERLFENEKFKVIKAIEENDPNNKYFIKRIKDKTFSEYMYDSLITLSLNLFLTLSNILATSISIPFISDIDNDKYTYELFKMCCFISLGKTSSFISELKKVYENNKRDYGIVRRLVRLFIVLNGMSDKEMAAVSSITSIKKINLLKYNYSFGRRNKS